MTDEAREKLQRLLPHWIEHSLEHAETFRQWSNIARDRGRETAAQHLERAARLTEEAAAALRDATKE